ncbi:hypothetical protein I6F15_00605 [Bradyrhizobium sp. BRP14]|nr:hypothetical protein [Bradyrhizobium sp. BRP14]
MHNRVDPPTPPVDDLALPEATIISELEQRIAALELKADNDKLSGEAKYRELLIDEIQQRIYMRNWVIVISILVMIFMAGALTHAAHSYFWGPLLTIPQAVVIAMFVGPVVSISTITIMLLIGAFRRFKDDDMNINIPSLAAEAAKSGIAGQ